jgi:DNA-binding NarL/FixJ family response regulator
VKVLLSSGYSIDGEARDILERGCKGFIQKPYSAMAFSQRIREILEEGKKDI